MHTVHFKHLIWLTKSKGKVKKGYKTILYRNYKHWQVRYYLIIFTTQKHFGVNSPLLYTKFSEHILTHSYLFLRKKNSSS